MADAYEAWIERQAGRLSEPSEHLAGHEAAAAAALATARRAAGRLRVGIDVLASDPDAAEAFRFANHAMWQQRVHVIAAKLRPSDDTDWDFDAALNDADIETNRSWRPFQLAFILSNIPSLVFTRGTLNASAKARWSTRRSSRPVVARPRATWASLPSRWPSGGYRASWPATVARVWR